MNLARAQLVETYRPTYASVNFSSGLPANYRPAASDPVAGSSNRETRKRDKKRPDLDIERKARLESRKNGHFVVAGEKGYTVWNNSTRPVSPPTTAERDTTRDKGKRKEGVDEEPPRKVRPTEQAGPVRLCERGESIRSSPLPVAHPFTDQNNGLAPASDLGGSLDIAVPLPFTPLLALVGGGREPVFPPNKVVIYHDKWPVPALPPASPVPPTTEPGEEIRTEGHWPGKRKGQVGRVIASIEYPEAVKAVRARMNTIVVVLSESVIWYEYGMHPKPAVEPIREGESSDEDDGMGPFTPRGTTTSQAGGFWLVKKKEWRTAYNPDGHAALSADVGSCLLAIPGRQAGHVQLIQLTSVIEPGTTSTDSPSDPHPAFRSPIINAHSHPLSSLACSSDGKYVVSSSERGSIFRVWNVATGSLERELRRGVDKAVIWGVDLVYRPAHDDMKLGKELWMVCWSDKGTVHVWGDVLGRNKPTAAQTEAARRNQSVTPKQALNSLLKPYIPVPKYFQATKSSALFRLPLEETAARPQILGRSSSTGPSMRELALRDRYVVAWQSIRDTRGMGGGHDLPGYVPELQLVIVTHAGEWYRLAVPERKYTGMETSEVAVDRPVGDEEDTDVRVDRCSVIDYVDLNVVDEW